MNKGLVTRRFSASRKRQTVQSTGDINMMMMIMMMLLLHYNSPIIVQLF